MAENLKILISDNDLTNWKKYAFLVLLLGYLMLMFSMVTHSGPYSLKKFGILILFNGFVFLIYYGSFRWIKYLKFVSFDKTNLYVSSAFKEAIIPIEKISEIKEEKDRKTIFVQIKLNFKSEFGTRIVFIPKNKEVYQMFKNTIANSEETSGIPIEP